MRGIIGRISKGEASLFSMFGGLRRFALGSI